MHGAARDKRGHSRHENTARCGARRARQRSTGAGAAAWHVERLDWRGSNASRDMVGGPRCTRSERRHGIVDAAERIESDRRGGDVVGCQDAASMERHLVCSRSAARRKGRRRPHPVGQLAGGRHGQRCDVFRDAPIDPAERDHRRLAQRRPAGPMVAQRVALTTDRILRSRSRATGRHARLQPSARCHHGST